MRYYAIKLTASVPSSFKAQAGAAVSGAQWCSVVNGQNDPGALNIEFDISLLGASSDAPLAWIRIWGIPLAQISQAANLMPTMGSGAGTIIELFAGYTDGLPLANVQVPHQGSLFKGKIIQCFGNWQMTDLTLDIYAQPLSESYGNPAQPVNIVHNMPANTPLKDAIQKTLKTAFPKTTPKITINDKLKLPYQDAGFYESLEQYSAYIRQLSLSIMKGPSSGGTGGATGGKPSNYDGVHFYPDGDNIVVTDKPHDGSIALKYYDLIGQPTWIKPNVYTVKTVLRADIKPQNRITLPPTLVTTTQAGSFTTSQGGQAGSGQGILSFQGEGVTQSCRFVGNFRQPNGDAWAAIYTVLSSNPSQANPGQIGSSNGTQASPQNQTPSDTTNAPTPSEPPNSIGPTPPSSSTPTPPPSPTPPTPQAYYPIPKGLPPISNPTVYREHE